jgi:hypothetical protein
MGMMDRLGALGRGAAQSASGGWVDEIYPKILANLPQPSDPEGIPREYAGGSQEEQYKQGYRADDQEAQRKYPANFAAGQLAGAAPAAIAAGGLGAGGMVGAGTIMGALQGAGASENSGRELAKDAIRGGAIGGATASAGNAVAAAAPGIKQAWQKLMQGPPPGASGGLQPVMAGGSQQSTMLPRKATNSFVNRSESVQDMPAQRAEQMLPPRPGSGDLRASVPPPEIPKGTPKIPQFDEADLIETEKRLRQTEDSWAKQHAARMQDRANPQPATVRPGKAQAR